MGCCGETAFEKHATNAELDREPSEVGRVRAERDAEITEHGSFGPEGGTLSKADVEDALATLTRALRGLPSSSFYAG